jgi:hypothetical protein
MAEIWLNKAPTMDSQVGFKVKLHTPEYANFWADVRRGKTLRERALLLVLPRDPFEQLFNGEDAVSHVFLDVIQREIVATVRQTLRTHARLAASD